MTIKRETHGGVEVLFLEGRLDGPGSAELKTCVAQLAAAGRGRLVLEMSGLSHLDSSGLGALLAALRSTARIEGDLRLAGLTAHAWSILQVTRLHRIFQVYPEVAQAVASFAD